MTIQIVKQRAVFDPKKEKLVKPMTFMSPKVNAPSVQDLFMNIEDYIKDIPEEERYNLHYSLCECIDDAKRPRVFCQQDIIAFDIDGIDVELIDSYVEPILQSIGDLNKGDVGIVASGRGLHFLIGTTAVITSPDYFKETKAYYKLVCDRINRKLVQLNLIGNTDTAIWSAGHTLRLPLTKNIKTPKHGYPNVDFSGECTLITRVINPIPDLDIRQLAGGMDFPEEGYVEVKGKEVGGRYSVDTHGILDGCAFLKWNKEHPEQVNEPAWYGMLSIVPHLDNGREICHELSSGHPHYNRTETEEKIDQALTCSGPRTCDNIATLWDGCKNCDNYQKITSPITIKSETFIKTEQTGFREIAMVKVGENPDGSFIFEETAGKIQYEDLRKFFERQHRYVATEARIVYIHNGTHWELMADTFIDGFCQDHVHPAPNSQNCSEFRKLVFRTNIVKNDWFDKTTFKRLNLKNGVLDLTKKDPELKKHSHKFGFMSCLDYDYDPEAQSPVFDKFMDEVTLHREELKQILMEFAGYAFSNEKCLYAKALILLGEGANGKSTFLNTLTKLAGDGAYSSLSMTDLNSEQQRAQLQGKLFNLSEETPTKGFVDSSIFKNITAGGALPVKLLYKDPYTIRPRAKLMMACNKLPQTTDTTYGFLRRLLIIPFDAEFSDVRGNIDLDMEAKLEDELPGILNQIISGFQRLMSQKRFTESSASRAELSSYRDEIDPLITFVEDYFIVTEPEKEGPHITNSELYRSYQRFCEEFGIKAPHTRIALGKRLASIIPKFKERKDQTGTPRVRILRGLEIIASNGSAHF